MTYSKEIKVGLSIVVAAIVFFVGLRFLQNVPIFKSSYALQTEFQDAGGLVAGNPVQMKGVNIGTVESVKLDLSDQVVRVIFRVEEDVKVPQGSFAEASGFSALSGVKLAITPGPASNPPVEPGSTLPGPPQGGILEQLSDAGPRLVSRADSTLTDASIAMQALSEKVSNPTSNLNQLISALEQTGRNLERATDDEALGNTIENLEAVTADLRRLSGETQAAEDSLSENNLGEIMARLNRSLNKLDRNLANLERSTTNLGEITDKINNGDGTAGRLINDPSLYNRLDSAAVQANELLRDLQENPNRYLDDMTLVKVF
ncbi:mammalian cell entry protein [Longibacter salinarum]|uniref:Mammalian cell entry protein n=1 Tax=Longibacter salinarum TaxID=1850348 RepID=A0A2A8D048_9BACT|nr:MlaD family protein [Longibacter salinarum]PEN14213.1 mammalian cell entry protein [Longibacter salinarum]